jgi:hypothetical protein
MDTIMKLIYENNQTNKNKLPELTEDVINYIKTYTGEVKLRNDIYMRQIPKNDLRYSLLKNKPVITYYKNSSIDETLKGFVWWKVNNKYMMITVFNNKKTHVENGKDDFLHEYFYDDKHIITRI